ncbi:MAG: CbiX/SirB N-terminal domain-containing protein [Burkholderiales bacterium]|nr:CbiX/SirB N-terminal domain-containing protein [Burkholderiales bacterium]
MNGLILFAHGARDPRWAAPFEAVAARLRQRRPDAAVRLAFLELMQPSLGDAAAELAAAGCTRLTVLPMFLGTGGHLRQDLPRLADALRAALPGIEVVLHGAIGEVDAVIAAMAEAAAALIDDATGASPP